MKTYTKEEVIKLLEKQKEICYESARIVESRYTNPYSESDGLITRIIDKKSILDSKYPKL